MLILWGPLFEIFENAEVSSGSEESIPAHQNFRASKSAFKLTFDLRVENMMADMERNGN